jgi:hypothetical protein
MAGLEPAVVGTAELVEGSDVNHLVLPGEVHSPRFLPS